MRSLLNLGRAVGTLVTAFLVMIAVGGYTLLSAATGSGGCIGPVA